MITRHGHMATPEASRFLTRLCYHFRRKIPVEYDETRGNARFPWGECVMRADAEHLSFDCSAGDAGALARVQHAIDSHVQLFSRKSPLQVAWDAPVQVHTDTHGGVQR
ncbi:DUF2218 domain-containing protein [Acidovorax sp. NCPPB 3859]|nr:MULTISPECIES: DUF2218 domain-containing protein [unclassified Acidovorax]MDA8449893.1 DUF2218 domain-containing protein [Acidovorax sp. GBBC 3297]MDA8459338.1 DUF2218 domain-containing protein [Acidovorax sp. GBBC 3333]MDA8464375.1 DUF2218 domain-containing protein [Acidovorax sp. GBBC 3332]MDA8469414.1 DUF2218 domain-containing protein [Acidovorax sp. GBBC 3299]WCM79049.1 DUF2218 domain-containing protein [Acidovorax sp. GBBC 712]